MAEVLDRSAVRIADLLAASREFASDASHQLRTPLTALSMRLEEMIEAAEYPDVVREEGVAAAAQVERLAAVVEQLLARAKHDPTGDAVPIGVDDIVAQQIEEWAAGLPARGPRGWACRERAASTAVVSPGGLSQIVATLLDNSLVHGDGTGHDPHQGDGDVDRGGGRRRGHGVPAELERRVFDRNVSGRQGTGLGLYLARSLATADGGRLELVRLTAGTLRDLPAQARRGAARQGAGGQRPRLRSADGLTGAAE